MGKIQRLKRRRPIPQEKMKPWRSLVTDMVRFVVCLFPRLDIDELYIELKRDFGLIGMLGFSFSIVTCWSALSGVLIVGVESGGPPVMIWSWVGVCIVSLSVAYSMAEMCSAYPTAGGQYSWVAILAPPRWSRGLSYVCGWFMLIGRSFPSLPNTSSC